MMMRLLTFCLVSFMAMSAYAETVPEHPFVNQSGSDSQANPESPMANGQVSLPRPKAKPDSPMREKPEFLLRMSKRDCRAALRRADRAGRSVAGADYVPGVDVRGKPVAGADLPGTLGTADILPEDIAFQLALSPLNFAGNPALAEIFANTATDIGTVTYSLSTGDLTVNGVEVEANMEARFVHLCREVLGK